MKFAIIVAVTILATSGSSTAGSIKGTPDQAKKVKNAVGNYDSLQKLYQQIKAEESDDYEDDSRENPREESQEIWIEETTSKEVYCIWEALVEQDVCRMKSKEGSEEYKDSFMASGMRIFVSQKSGFKSEELEALEPLYDRVAAAYTCLMQSFHHYTACMSESADSARTTWPESDSKAKKMAELMHNVGTHSRIKRQMNEPSSSLSSEECWDNTSGSDVSDCCCWWNWFC